ncbi:hypothetical protein ACFQ48_13410 [Hymenobacter caeli]|uniref:DUF4136 domain-containing protein n=1 Tax=Hymenobacter caeli TaxID=2735894 RepID=A0ABX2FT68_9BACT|nr:hypothetical protein [Hymenobacter caeli]NRT20385.1 hypothetical protein [Hymenobacter caeli]
MKKTYLFTPILFILNFILTSCLDMSEQQIVGPYLVADDPAGYDKTLYYFISEGPDTSRGIDAERIHGVSKVGYTADFIFAKRDDGFYQYIIRAQDFASDIGDPAVRSAMSTPLSEKQFQRVLDSLAIPAVEFQWQK